MINTALLQREYNMVKGARLLIVCRNNEFFNPGDKVISLVYNSPIIRVGTEGIIVKRWVGPLYAAKLPNGQFYKWLAVQDLRPVDPLQQTLRVGDFAIIDTNREDSFTNPFVVNGVIVRIIKNIEETDYYGISVTGGNINNAWLAGFDISNVF